MFPKLHAIGFTQKSFYFPRRTVPLHAMVSSCGYQRASDPGYDWHGLRRGNAEFVLLQYTTGGLGRLRHGTSTYDVRPGHAMLLHFPHDNRYWLPESSPHWEFLYICLHGSDVLRVWREVERRNGPLLSCPPASPLAKHAARTVVHLLTRNVDSPFAASAMAYELTMVLADEFLMASRGQATNPRIESVARQCRANLAEPLTVDDMAERAAYSRHHFTRLFTQHEGIPPGQFLRELRLRHAVSLLQTTTLSVKEVAQQSGYYDATHFCKTFRRAMSMTPHTFRRSGMYVRSGRRREGR